MSTRKTPLSAAKAARNDIDSEMQDIDEELRDVVFDFEQSQALVAMADNFLNNKNPPKSLPFDA